MLTLELFSIVMEIPNDAYITLSRNLTLSQEYCEPDWLILENNEKATLNINMPYLLNPVCFGTELHLVRYCSSCVPYTVVPVP